MNNPLVTAVMPCLNEARTIAVCIEKARECLRKLGIEGEILVADNGSTDGSIEIARSAGARVVCQLEKGYGAALRKGIESAQGEIVVMADGDDSYDWSGMGAFIAKIQQGYDLVIGNRFKGGIAPGAMPLLHRYLGNPVLSRLARFIYRAPIGDFHCGMRAFTRAAYSKMSLRTSGMEFATEMVVNAVRAGLRIAEVPTTLKPDGRNRPPHLRSFRDGWRHLRFILTYAPNYLYLAPGGLMMLAGCVLVGSLAGGPIVMSGYYFGIHFLALGCALTLAGFNIVHLGVLAKVIAVTQLPHLESRVHQWALKDFTLESGLIIGLVLFLCGAGTDAVLLWKWLSHFGQPLDETVHVAFVATLLIILGLNIMFSSFLLNMFALGQRSCPLGDTASPGDQTSP